MLVVLVLRLFRTSRRIDAAWVALAGTLLALWIAAPWRLATDSGVLSEDGDFHRACSCMTVSPPSCVACC